MSEASSKTGWVVAALLAVAIIGGFVYVRGQRAARVIADTAAPVAGTGANMPGTATTAPAASTHSPVSTALATAGTAAPPPGLGVSDGSDGSVRAALQALAGGSPIDSLLVPDFLIQHIVATIDALPQKEVPANLLPLRPARGSLVTVVSGGVTTLDAANARRYEPYMQVLNGLDAGQLVAWYARNYTLFQQAYRQLGKPAGEFNDRLVTVIDHLLATPEPTAPIVLTQPNVRFQFADPALQSLSAGQKMLLRAGPANEARIKAKLRAIRAALTGVHPDGAVGAP